MSQKAGYLLNRCGDENILGMALLGLAVESFRSAIRDTARSVTDALLSKISCAE